MGVGASFVLGPSRPPLRWRGGLLRVWIIEAPVAWVWGPPLIWDHRGPRRVGAGASFALGQVPAALARPPRLDHRGPCRMGVGASFDLGPPRPPPRWQQGRGGLRRGS